MQPELSSQPDPMSEPTILAIDLGTSGPKVALFSLRGTVVAGTAEAVRLHMLPGGGVEQEPAEWWTACLLYTSGCTQESALKLHC